MNVSMKRKRKRQAVGGELLSPLRVLARAAVSAGPGVFWITVFLILPALVLFVYSFLSRDTIGDVSLPFTLENYRRFIGFSIFGYDPVYFIIIARSAVVALVTTFICIVLAYPLAFFIAAHNDRWRNILLTLVIVPSWTNLVIRTYAWMILFAADSPLSKLARGLGLLGTGEGIYPSVFAVYVGTVYTFLSFMVLPIYTAVERLDWSLVEAAKDLYASRWQTFWQVILPQTLPGLVAGCIVTLIPAFGIFVVTDLLGSSKVSLIGNVISQQFSSSRDWPFGATLSFLVMGISFLTLYLYGKRMGEKGMRDLL
jgi:spermidine/putrescine transport system permease protein